MAERLSKYDTSESPDTRTASDIELTHRPYGRMLGPSSTAAKFNEGWKAPAREDRKMHKAKYGNEGWNKEEAKTVLLKDILKDAVSVDDVQIEIDSRLAMQKTKRESLFPKSEAPAMLPQLANNNPMKKGEL